MNNLLDSKNENNFLFLASVIAVLCEQSPITIRLEDVERFWKGEITKLQYDMVYTGETKTGSITFSLGERRGN